MERIITLGYDIMTYNGEQPNCLNPKFLSTIHAASDFYFSDSLEFYVKRWNQNWALYNSNMYNDYAEKKSIYQIVQDRKNEINYDWFYLIEPFSNLENFDMGSLPNDVFDNPFSQIITRPSKMNEDEDIPF